MGIDENVTITYDQMGVPHIEAKTRRDMFKAFGFVHARDRLFQMEINRRISQGRLSEILGENALQIDRLFRIYGFHRMAEYDQTTIDDEFKVVVSSYLSGVNLFISEFDSQYPIEFTLLGVKPEPWTMVDILSYARLMAWQFAYGDMSEISRSQISEVLNEEMIKEFETKVNLQFFSNKTHYDIDFNHLSNLLSNFIAPGGSNAYAVSGKYTKSGKPIAANDPHVQLLTPSIWYQTHLTTHSKTEHYNVVGVSFPGLPFVLIGHNDFVSWGCVLSMVDIKDHYIEKFDWHNGKYEYLGKQIRPKVHHEEILIKGGDIHTEIVYETVHGPLVSKLSSPVSPLQTEDGYHLETSLHSLSFRKNISAYTGFYRLNTASNFGEFAGALKLFDVVTLGVVFGTTDGDFGYFVTGDLPIRKAGDGLIPREGWTGEYDWEGTIPFEERPFSLNPEQGFVVAANNRLVNYDYPYYLGESFAVEWRALRITNLIEELIATGKKIEVQDLADMQHDAVDLNAFAFKKVFFDVFDDSGLNLSDQEKQALEHFKNWDGNMDTETIGGTISQVMIVESLKVLFNSKLNESLSRRLSGITDSFIIASEFNSHSQFNLVKVLQNESSLWWENNGGRKQVLYTALNNSVKWLSSEAGSNPNGWKWGNIHRVTWKHIFGAGKTGTILDRVFSVGPYPAVGSMHTPSQATYVLNAANKKYDLNGAGISYKQVVDLGNLDESLWLNAPGQSGRLSSRNHDNQASLWLEGKHTQMLWNREHINAASTSRITFVKSASS